MNFDPVPSVIRKNHESQTGKGEYSKYQNRMLIILKILPVEFKIKPIIKITGA
jgi:hypothetical protein